MRKREKKIGKEITRERKERNREKTRDKRCPGSILINLH